MWGALRYNEWNYFLIKKKTLHSKALITHIYKIILGIGCIMRFGKFMGHWFHHFSLLSPEAFSFYHSLIQNQNSFIHLSRIKIFVRIVENFSARICFDLVTMISSFSTPFRASVPTVHGNAFIRCHVIFE